MNKNSLSQLNKLYVERCRQLTVQNQELQLKVDALQKAVTERNEIIEQLMAQAERVQPVQETAPVLLDDNLFTQQTVEEPIIEKEEAEPQKSEPAATAPTLELPSLDSISEYASKAISQMVISSAKHSNIITSSSYENKKDLLNLIIGKCETAKYEISDILQSNCSDAQKAQMIDACAKDAIEYFGCVIEQK